MASTAWWGRLWGQFHSRASSTPPTSVNVTATPLTATTRFIAYGPTVQISPTATPGAVTTTFVAFSPRLAMISNPATMQDAHKQFYSAIEFPPPVGVQTGLYRHLVNKYKYPNLFILRDGTVSTAQVMGGFEERDPVKTYLWGDVNVVLDSFDLTALTTAGYVGIDVGARP